MSETRAFPATAVASVVTGRAYGAFVETVALCRWFLGGASDIGASMFQPKLAAELRSQFPDMPADDEFIGDEAITERFGLVLEVTKQ